MFHGARMCARCSVKCSNLSWHNPLVTLCLSDGFRCGAVRILTSLAQPSRHFARVRSHSLCGTVRIRADSAFLLEVFVSRSGPRSFGGPCDKILCRFWRSWSSKRSYSSLSEDIVEIQAIVPKRSLREDLSWRWPVCPPEVQAKVTSGKVRAETRRRNTCCLSRLHVPTAMAVAPSLRRWTGNAGARP